MSTAKPHKGMTPASVRRVMLRDGARLERVQRVVDFMNRVVGYGWARRMEYQDHYMDQDYPRVWLAGRKRVSARNLLRFEQYAVRFGYLPPVETSDKPSTHSEVLNALNTVNKSNSAHIAPMSDVLENISGPSSLNKIDPSTQGLDVPST